MLYSRRRTGEDHLSPRYVARPPSHRGTGRKRQAADVAGAQMAKPLCLALRNSPDQAQRLPSASDCGGERPFCFALVIT
jgi:hypothetical protein